MIYFRIMGVIACLAMVFDCINFATGNVSQHVFGESFIWLWWVVAVIWTVNTVALMIDAVTADK